MGALVLCAGVLAAVPGPQGQEPAWERLGRAYLEALGVPAEPLKDPTEERASAFLELLRPTHQVLDLGGLELWIPARVLGSDGKLAPGLTPEAAAGWAADLLELERRWVELLLRPGDALELRRANLAQLSRWTGEIARGVQAPDAELPGSPLVEARRALHALCSTTGEPTPALLIAPTRVHLVALTAAAGVLVPSERDRLWSPELRSVGYTNPLRGLVAVSLMTGPDEGSDGLVGVAVAPGDVRALVVHRGAHFLIEQGGLGAPLWLSEGLALDLTIGIVGNDDSPCTGFWQRDQLANLLWLPHWIEADLSPYREGPSASWFAKELAPDERGGFAIWDLERSKVALCWRGPVLGGGHDPHQSPPEAVQALGLGAERGWAEFVRAYSAAFVHWLGLEQVGGRAVLAWLIEFLRDPARWKGLAEGDIVPTALQMITQKTLGASADPERDLEAAFARWLAAR